MLDRQNTHYPLHRQVTDILRSWIQERRFAPGDRLPSEFQLIRDFGVSRITVRRAIGNLVREGLLRAEQGRGVFVQETRKVRRSLAAHLRFFEDEMRSRGIAPGIKSISYERIASSPWVASSLQLSPGATVYCQTKIILADGLPIAIDVTYLPELVGGQLAEELQTQFVYPTLENHRISVERVHLVLECTPADPQTARHLEVEVGASLLVARYTAYTVDDYPLICGETLSRADRYSYSIDLLRTQLGQDEG
ncbi:GntR family transcriptional regulator [Leptolyngbya sp. FACHB-261]|uniref:GntR family transcriptional regulator n=1 Tax=Leptolyngbya sp. FACHB-261 TaxID=2692806 RepID=UPI001681E6F0|nr:GntR family transcriptional regulator [Leptolyngbya sp. FACHB-261]MBD2103613.1 GntR family transcriptional regulator [Leptolyngbya sp. FACHB-261]